MGGARFLLTQRMITVTPGVLIVALLAFMGTVGPMTGTLTLSKAWSVAGIVTIILVTAAVGLFVADHQPRNPIGWLLAGEAVFMLLSVGAGERLARRRDHADAGHDRRAAGRVLVRGGGVGPVLRQRGNVRGQRRPGRDGRGHVPGLAPGGGRAAWHGPV
jgi:hypothetical protein